MANFITSLRDFSAMVVSGLFLQLSSLSAQSQMGILEDTSFNKRKPITASDYVFFLNSVAPFNNDDLYSEKMATDPLVACIVRTGIPGSYHYAVIAGQENYFVSYLTWLSKARYCNWLQQRDPDVDYVSATINDGAYSLTDIFEALSKGGVKPTYDAAYYIADDPLDTQSEADLFLSSNKDKDFFSAINGALGTLSMDGNSSLGENDHFSEKMLLWVAVAGFTIVGINIDRSGSSPWMSEERMENGEAADRKGPVLIRSKKENSSDYSLESSDHRRNDPPMISSTHEGSSLGNSTDSLLRRDVVMNSYDFKLLFPEEISDYEEERDSVTSSIGESITPLDDLNISLHGRLQKIINQDQEELKAQQDSWIKALQPRKLELEQGISYYENKKTSPFSNEKKVDLWGYKMELLRIQEYLPKITSVTSLGNFDELKAQYKERAEEEEKVSNYRKKLLAAYESTINSSSGISCESRDNNQWSIRSADQVAHERLQKGRDFWFQVTPFYEASNEFLLARTRAQVDPFRTLQFDHDGINRLQEEITQIACQVDNGEDLRAVLMEDMMTKIFITKINNKLEKQSGTLVKPPLSGQKRPKAKISNVLSYEDPQRKIQKILQQLKDTKEKVNSLLTDDSFLLDQECEVISKAPSEQPNSILKRLNLLQQKLLSEQKKIEAVLSENKEKMEEVINRKKIIINQIYLSLKNNDVVKKALKAENIRRKKENLQKTLIEVLADQRKEYQQNELLKKHANIFKKAIGTPQKAGDISDESLTEYSPDHSVSTSGDSNRFDSPVAPNELTLTPLSSKDGSLERRNLRKEKKMKFLTQNEHYLSRGKPSLGKGSVSRTNDFSKERSREASLGSANSVQDDSFFVRNFPVRDLIKMVGGIHDEVKGELSTKTSSDNYDKGKYLAPRDAGRLKVSSLQAGEPRQKNVLLSQED